MSVNAMWKRICLSIGTSFLLLMVLFASASARNSLEAQNSKGFSAMAAAAPAECITVHKIGKIALSVTNAGNFGNNYIGGPDCLTGEGTVACQYPKNSGIDYLFAAAFWVGAVSGRDTLVSVGADGWRGIREMFPDASPLGDIIHRSLIDPTNTAEFEGAVSEDDVIVTYRDTLTAGIANDVTDNRPHRPLFIKVDESSYAWSYSYAEDFVLFDYKITNEGINRLEKVFMGIYVDADVGEGATCATNSCYADDICGFVHATPETTRSGCEYTDTVNIAWIADNDGDPGNSGNFENTSAPAVTATRIVRTPSEKLEVSFNWWISNGAAQLDFGPREKSGKGRLKEDLRPLGTGGLGTPEGDRNKYYFMRNQEFDYDQIFTATIQPGDTLWIEPISSLKENFSDGFDTRYLLSFGPFNIDPGETLPLSFAYVAGDNFHVDPNNGPDNLDNNAGNYDPIKYYQNLNFEDLTTNARWASWIYDNPGVDTDGDGFKGKFIECIPILTIDTIVVGSDTTFDTLEFVADTTYLTGDGVPDFQGAKPPPSPNFWILPEIGKLTLRFNGLRSETTPDEFLKVTGESPLDFEGYRVYYGRDERDASYQLFASYDREDYNKYVLVIEPSTGNEVFALFDTPYTIAELQTLYGDPGNPGSFNPLKYGRSSPFFFGDSTFYFAAQDYNVSEFGVDTPIKKIYPEQEYPSTLIAAEANPDELTEDGYFKYFEYEVEIPDLLPTVGYWVAITAFDYGSPASGLPSLESSKTVSGRFAYAQSTVADATVSKAPVYVYPNPYRHDGGYLEGAFEGNEAQKRDKAIDRTRAINFANLPANCTIRIYSLDGDLVRELEHRADHPSDPDASHEEWNLITRNTQLVVSGLYYWAVENNDTGEIQVGKLAIVM